MRLIDRLHSCFEGVDRNQQEEYLRILREAWRETSTTITRNAWIMVLLFAYYEFVARGAVKGVTVGPFSLANLDFLRLFVPAIVTYLFYEQVTLVIRWIETEAVHRYLVRALVPDIEEYDFDALLAPRLSALSNITHSYSPSSATLSKHLRAAGQYILAVIFICIVPIFDGLAFRSIYSDFGPTSFIYWLNVGVTALFLALALLVLALWAIEERLLTEGV